MIILVDKIFINKTMECIEVFHYELKEQKSIGTF
jgi:hypothetical protein